MKYFLPCRRSNIPGVPYQLTPALLRFRPKGFQVDYSLSWILSPGNRFCGRPSPRVLATPLSSLKRKHTQRIRYSRRWTRCLIKLPINRISIFLQNNSLEGQKREGKRQRNYRKVNRSITNNFPHDVFNQRTFAISIPFRVKCECQFLIIRLRIFFLLTLKKIVYLMHLS